MNFGFGFGFGLGPPLRGSVETPIDGVIEVADEAARFGLVDLAYGQLVMQLDLIKLYFYKGPVSPSEAGSSSHWVEIAYLVADEPGRLALPAPAFGDVVLQDDNGGLFQYRSIPDALATITVAGAGYAPSNGIYYPQQDGGVFGTLWVTGPEIVDWYEIRGVSGEWVVGSLYVSDGIWPWEGTISELPSDPISPAPSVTRSTDSPPSNPHSWETFNP